VRADPLILRRAGKNHEQPLLFPIHRPARHFGTDTSRKRLVC
jgi:hypothetical protein